MYNILEGMETIEEVAECEEVAKPVNGNKMLFLNSVAQMMSSPLIKVRRFSFKSFKSAVVGLCKKTKPPPKEEKRTKAVSYGCFIVPIQVITGTNYNNNLDIIPVSSQSSMTPLRTPIRPCTSAWKRILPSPELRIARFQNTLYLDWKLLINLDQYEDISYYQVYVHRPPLPIIDSNNWERIGHRYQPSSCYVFGMSEGVTYNFIVRGVDIHGREGLFSDMQSLIY